MKEIDYYSEAQILVQTKCIITHSKCKGRNSSRNFTIEIYCGHCLISMIVLVFVLLFKFNFKYIFQRSPRCWHCPQLRKKEHLLHRFDLGYFALCLDVSPKPHAVVGGDFSEETCCGLCLNVPLKVSCGQRPFWRWVNLEFLIDSWYNPEITGVNATPAPRKVVCIEYKGWKEACFCCLLQPWTFTPLPCATLSWS